MPASGGHGADPVSVNVLVAEDSLQAIADAIRAKNGSQNTYTPAQMAAAIRAISGGGNNATLGTKTIFHNGTHQASGDSLDGYSSVAVDVHPGLMEPYEEELTTGYVDSGVWKLGGTNCFSDVYLVESGVTYLIALGDTVGTRFRVMFCTDDPTEASANITGTNVINTSNPAAYACRTYQTTAAGYLIIQKDNAGTANLKTYVFALPELTNGDPMAGNIDTVLQSTLTVTANGTYLPAAGIDGFASVTVNVPTEASVMTSKTITANGVYDPEDDNVDGYSEVTVDVHPGLITPYAFDLDTGYVFNDAWVLGGETVSYSDVYQVTAGEWYIISLGSVVGSRFRAIFTTADTTQVEERTAGSRVVNISDPSPRAYVCYKPSSDGYITITKDNAGMAGLKTYVYSGASMALGNP